MLITGKIFEESRTSLITTPLICVQTGKLEPSSASMKKAVSFRQPAQDAMAGKNKNITLTTIKLSHVLNLSVVETYSAHSTTTQMIEEFLINKA
jgi:hypothetical protein